MHLLKLSLLSAVAAASPAGPSKTTTITSTYTYYFTSFVTNTASTTTSYYFPESHSCFTSQGGGDDVAATREPRVTARGADVLTTTTFYTVSSTTVTEPGATTYISSPYFKLSNGLYGDFAGEYKASKGQDFVFNATKSDAAVFQLSKGAAGKCELTVGPAFKGVGVYPNTNPGPFNFGAASTTANLVNCTITNTLFGYSTIDCARFGNPKQNNTVVCKDVWELATSQNPTGCSSVEIVAVPAKS